MPFRSVVFSRYFVSCTNKTDCHDITEILLNVALNIINLNQSKTNIYLLSSFDNKSTDNTCTDGTGSCKANYHMIMTTMAPFDLVKYLKYASI
jgi:hypothetical protein